METVRVISLKNLPKRMRERLREAQLEAGRVYTEAKNLHLAARKSGLPWPGKVELQKATKGRFALHSQTVQMIVHAFLANVETTRKLRRDHPEMEMKYPWRDKMFYPLHWPKQAMSVKNGRLVLPMGRGRASLVLKVELSELFGACKIVWNDGYELHICRGIEAVEENCGTERATVDLGQIHQAAVTTTTGQSLIVSGRGLRSEKRLRNKALGEIARKRSKCKKGSRRWRKLQRARSKITARSERRCRDLQHKGTSKVIGFCKRENVGTLYVGNPDGVQRKDCGRKQNQRMSQWEFGRDLSYLRHKSERNRIECFTGTERGTSSQCPECGHKQKVSGRRWRCRKCGFEGHRDLVGSVNMHPLAFGKKINFPHIQTYLRAGAVRLGRRVKNSNRGHTPARSSSPDAGQRRNPLLSEVGRKHGQRAFPRRASDGLGSIPLTLEAHPL